MRSVISAHKRPHTFLVHVVLVNYNQPREVNIVREIFREGLKTVKTCDDLEMFLKTEISKSEVFGRPYPQGFLLWLDQWGRSYFLNIFVPEKQNICMCAVYYGLDSLRDLSLYTYAKQLRQAGTSDSIDNMEIPECLKEDLKKTCEDITEKYKSKKS